MQLSARSCQTCHTTVTSQWRYGLSGKVLLCNACGIRWKRKNKVSDKKRLKPGPKRIRQSSAPPLPPSCVLQPSLSAMFYNPSSNSLINKNLSSSSSSATDPRLDAYTWQRHQQTSRAPRKQPPSKMDLDQLVSPQNTYEPLRPKTPRRRHTAHSSPISINSLLNFADDDGTNTACSTIRQF